MVAHRETVSGTFQQTDLAEACYCFLVTRVHACTEEESGASSWDADGSLSSELELQHRDGDPNDQVRIPCSATTDMFRFRAIEFGKLVSELHVDCMDRSGRYLATGGGNCAGWWS
jgi:hypothetical protein